jgi:hypothetical protein
MRLFTHQTPIIIADEDPDASGLNVEHAAKGGNYYRWFNTLDNSWYYYNGVDWTRVGDGTINTEAGFSIGGDAGVDGVVELARFGSGKIKLTFKGGIVTEIEDEE